MICTVADIIDAVAHVSDVSRHEILSRRQQSRPVRARQLVCWLAKRYTLMSYPAIGRAMGDRDHTTVMYSERHWDVYRDFLPYGEWESAAVARLEASEVA